MVLTCLVLPVIYSLYLECFHEFLFYVVHQFSGSEHYIYLCWQVLPSTDHINSCKPVNKNDPSYAETLGFLEKKFKSRLKKEDS
jgi:hypothetical protein